MGFTDGFDVLTVPYKIISSHPILADILIPSSLPTGPAPLMLHIHGGWFVTGARNTYAYIPAWVPQLALASNAIIVSGDYRLLPGATGAELNEDLEDFWTWVHMSLQSVLDEHSQGKAKVEADLTRILLNGGSAGGYCVIQLALSHPDEVKAVIAGYPMVDVDGGLSGHGNGGKPIMGVAPPSEAELDVLVAEARKPGAVVTMGGMERSRMAMGSQAWGRAREWLGEAPGIAPFKRIQEGARLPKRV
ncbi:hypothetical protein MMC19_002199 [Ptychographa xylographoides]|nr:hypothetical protein [Ptychographa xylographoides]